MSGILVIEDSASKGIFPALVNMKESLTDKKTYFSAELPWLSSARGSSFQFRGEM